MAQIGAGAPAGEFMAGTSWLGRAVNALDRASSGLVLGAGLLSVAMLSVAGILAGWELPLSVLYLLPLVVVAAAAGQRAAFAIAAFAGVARTVVAAAIAPIEMHRLTPVLTFLTCFITYWLVGGLVAALGARLREEQIVGRRDPLTGLANARCFYESVERQRGRLFGAPFVVAYLDLDNFKHVNDTRGHSCGDAALADVGVTIAELLREHDLAARIGGDEFIILLPATGASPGRELLRGMHAALEQEVGHRWDIGFSVGALCCASWEDSVDALVQAADQAMYEAKLRRKGTVVLVDQTPRMRAAPLLDEEVSFVGAA